MKIALLTSDILDGRILCQRLLVSGNEPCLIIYERKRKSLKLRLRIFYLYLMKRLSFICFEGLKDEIRVKSTDNINNRENIELLRELGPELIVVAGTRRLIPDLFENVPKGAINLHTGILPFYRGADSEFWALYNNEPNKIGVTTHYIDKGLDSGDILIVKKQDIDIRDSYKSLHKKNMRLGAEAIIEAISLIESGSHTRIKQDENIARLYYAPTRKDRDTLKKRIRQRRRRFSCIKSFADNNNGISVEEEVSCRPLIESIDGLKINYPGTFCLRIDADEYHKENFDNYMEIFRKYKDCITVFFNGYSFSGAGDLIKRCSHLGVDVQSHGFYHYTYSDYESNRHNIRKAKAFFKEMGIDTKGFAAPMGRWNEGLARALEDEGYLYSSDFSYDYLGLPSFPYLRERISKVMEIPVFPVCPELFFQDKKAEKNRVVRYFQDTIDAMVDSAIPVIIYAHTSACEEIPAILKEVLEYALGSKGLRPIQMSAFHSAWNEGLQQGRGNPADIKSVKAPGKNLLGERALLSKGKRLKNFIKRKIDFETITPDNELCCHAVKRWAKRIFRGRYTKQEE